MDHKTALHPEIERELHDFEGVIATIGITGEVGLAHAGDEMFHAARSCRPRFQADRAQAVGRCDLIVDDVVPMALEPPAPLQPASQPTRGFRAKNPWWNESLPALTAARSQDDRAGSSLATRSQPEPGHDL